MFGLLFLTGCSAELTAQIKRLGFPPPASDRSPDIFNLWIGTWIAAVAVGILVWGLIGWAAQRYSTKHDQMPRQNRYNLPMEIFYTIVPFIIIGVLFYYTVVAQNKCRPRSPNPDVTIDVVGQKWSWTFNYKSADNPAVGQDVWEAGTINKTPDLYLPVGKSMHFNLSSPDVIHSFWIPSFYEKLDVVPGRHNNFYDHADHGGRVRRQVRRAVRHLPLGDAVQRPHRQRGRVQRLPEDPGRQGPDRRGQGSGAANTPVKTGARGGHAMTTLQRTATAAEIATPKRQLGTDPGSG